MSHFFVPKSEIVKKIQKCFHPKNEFSLLRSLIVKCDFLNDFFLNKSFVDESVLLVKKSIKSTLKRKKGLKKKTTQVIIVVEFQFLAGLVILLLVDGK